MARQLETEMSAHCRLCAERTEHDESAVVGEHLVCAECVARIGVQCRRVLGRTWNGRTRRGEVVDSAVAFAVAFDRATDGPRASARGSLAAGRRAVR